MVDSAQIKLSIVLLVVGLVIGLRYLALRPLLRRSRRGEDVAGPDDAPVRQRPVWMVVLLSILSLGFYLYIWFGQSWSDLKRGGSQLDMGSSSHQWAMAMGFDFFSRVRAHFRTINEQLTRRDLPRGVEPGTAIAMIASFVLIPVLVVNGQRSLNRIWRHDFGAASEPKVSTGEWVAIIALGLMYASVVLIYTGFG